MQCQLALQRFVAARVATDRGTGRDEKTSGTEQQAIHSGAGRGNLWAPSPFFYLAPRYDPPG
jgi:hypothetical protein